MRLMSDRPNWYARSFRAVKLERGWGVEVSDPGAIPWTITGFEAETEAVAWIQKEQQKIAASLT